MSCHLSQVWDDGFYSTEIKTKLKKDKNKMWKDHEIAMKNKV